MQFFPQEGYKRIFVLILYVILGFVLIWLVIRYLFAAFLPFLIAFSVAVLLRRPARFLSRVTKMPRRIVASFLAVLFASALLVGLSALVWRLITEVGAFAGAVLSGENPLLENLGNMLSRLGGFVSRLPLMGSTNAETLRTSITETVLDMAKNVAVELGTKLPEMAGRLMSAVPQTLIFFVVTVLSSVYFCADYEKLLGFFRKHLHGKPLEFAEKVRKAAGKTMTSLLKSYLVLFLFTFAELLLGFVILRVPYAFLTAFLTALVDSLPIVGTGIVLVPMALYRFFMGEVKMAIGLLVLYAVITVLRQVMEPRILGGGMGLHPLAMLAAMYAGLRLFGVLGMILLPMGAVIAGHAIRAFRAPEKGETP